MMGEGRVTQGTLFYSLLLLRLREDRSVSPPPPLWGRTEEGGRAAL